MNKITEHVERRRPRAGTKPKIITERRYKRNQPREKVHMAMCGDQAPASSALSGGPMGTR